MHRVVDAAFKLSVFSAQHVIGRCWNHTDAFQCAARMDMISGLTVNDGRITTRFLRCEAVAELAVNCFGTFPY